MTKPDINHNTTVVNAASSCGDVSIYVRAEGITQTESRLFALSLKEAGLDIFSIGLGILSISEAEEVILRVPEASKLLARRILGSKGGVVVLRGRGGAPSFAALTLDDTGFFIHG